MSGNRGVAENGKQLYNCKLQTTCVCCIIRVVFFFLFYFLNKVLLGRALDVKDG